MTAPAREKAGVGQKIQGLVRSTDRDEMVRCVRVVLLLALSLTLTACGAQRSQGNRTPTGVVQDYVRAINARDGQAVCASFTDDAVKQLSRNDAGLPCARAVATLIGYVEDSGSPEFLRYENPEVHRGSMEHGLRSVRLSLEARFYSDSAGGTFELCRFDDIVWLESTADGWEIAKPSLALYAAFGALQFPNDALDPPSDEARDEDAYLARSELLRCGPVVEDTAPVAGDWSSVSAARHLAEHAVHDPNVRCIDAAGRDGWDFVCTYHDAGLGKRMKIALAVTPDGKGLVSSGAVPEDSWLPPRS